MLIIFYKNLYSLIDSSRLNLSHFHKNNKPHIFNKTSEIFKSSNVENLRENSPIFKYNRSTKSLVGETPHMELSSTNNYTLYSYIYNLISNLW